MIWYHYKSNPCSYALYIVSFPFITVCHEYVQVIRLLTEYCLFGDVLWKDDMWFVVAGHMV
jgi:hypothetical protein